MKSPSPLPRVRKKRLLAVFLAYLRLALAVCSTTLIVMAIFSQNWPLLNGAGALFTSVLIPTLLRIQTYKLPRDASPQSFPSKDELMSLSPDSPSSPVKTKQG